MTRFAQSVSSVLAMAALLSGGCAASRVSSDDLAQRLDRLERRRLAPATGRAAERRHAMRSSGERPIGSGHRPAEDVALSDYAVADAPSDGGEPVADTPIDGGRDAPYLRRPLRPSFGRTVQRDAKYMAGDLWHDTKRVFGNPVNVAILGVTLGGSIAIAQTGPDDTVEDHYNRSHTFNEGWNETFATLGNPGLHFGVAGALYLAGHQMNDEKTYEVSRALFSALIINGVTTMVGQAASSDRSPNGEWGTFPSGHTSSSFAVASVMHQAYGPLAGIPLYGLSTLVAISRLDDREHYLSDVVMGAVLGTVIGHAVASGRDPEFFGWKVVPYADPASGAGGVALMKTSK